MKIDSQFQPTLAVSKDETRYALNNLHLDTAAKRLVATDGHMLCSIPVEVQEGDTTGPIQPDAFAMARKDQRKSGTVEIKANGSVALPNGVTYERPNVGQFPDYAQVIPEANRDGFKIGLDARLLYDLAVAIGSEKGRAIVTLCFGKDSADPIRVTRSDNEAVGVLMPCRI